VINSLRRPGLTRADRGMVTAELAVALPSLLMVLVLAVCLLGAAGAKLRCQQAARDGARLAARGEAIASVRAAARAEAPRGASVTVLEAPGTVQVIVAAPVGVPGWWQPWSDLRVAGAATAPAEGAS